MALLLAFRTLLAPLLDAIVKAYTSESSVSYINQSGATGRIDWWGGGGIVWETSRAQHAIRTISKSHKLLKGRQ